MQPCAGAAAQVVIIGWLRAYATEASGTGRVRRMFSTACERLPPRDLWDAIGSGGSGVHERAHFHAFVRVHLVDDHGVLIRLVVPAMGRCPGGMDCRTDAAHPR